MSTTRLLNIHRPPINSMFMSERIERMEEARKEARISYASLARAVGVKPQDVNNWKTRGNIPGDRVPAVASALGVSTDWLMSGKGPMRLQRVQARLRMPYDIGEAGQDEASSNISHAPSIKGEIPLISWVQAGEWSQICDHLEPGDAEKWLPCPDTHGPHAFGLRVQGDSMTNPHGPRSYPEGIIIFVDPDREAVNGSRVVARLRGDEATFKVYVEDAGKRFLRPLNPQYPIIECDGDCEIVGVVIGSYMPE